MRATGAVCTKYVYDNAGRLKEVTTAYNSNDASTTKYQYYANGSRKKMSYTRNGTDFIDVSYEYDAAARLVQATYPGFGGDSDTTTYKYDLDGKLDSRTDGAGRKATYIYDASSRLRSVTWGEYGTGKGYFYNDRSQIELIKQSDSTKIDYSYDSFGRLASVIDYTVFPQAADTQIDYTYYKSSLRKEMTTPDYKLKYEYDKAMRLKKIYRDVNGTYRLLAEYSYNALGQRTGLTRHDTDGSTVIIHTQYDYLSNVGWLTCLENRKQVANPGTNVISSFKYYDSTEGDGHDCVGNRKYIEFANGAYVGYTYDDRYQLETEARYNASDVQQYKYEWSYDDAGNRLYQKKWTSADTWDSYVKYTYNNANQLIDEDKYDTVSKGTWLAHTDYTFDDAGNMTDKVLDDLTEANVDEAWDYVYNYENRQVEVKKDSSTVGTYTYNVVGSRVQKAANSVTTKMFYDGADCVGDYDGTNTSVYVTPFLDENLLLQRSSSDYFYTQDGLGSVRELIDTSQVTQNSYDYEAFGSFYGTPAENVVNRYTYTGREWDAESAAYDYRWRTLLSSLGRFGQRDSVEHLNLYIYVANEPVSGLDPMGLDEWQDLKNNIEDFTMTVKEDLEFGNWCQATLGSQ